MNRRFICALILSAIAHALLALWFHSSPPAPAAKKPLPVAIEIVHKKVAGRKKGHSGRRPGRAVPLTRLTPRLSLEPGQTSDVNQASAKGTGEWREEHWGRGGGDFGEIANFLKYDRVREDLRGMLNYPYVFTSREIQGTINARLAFTDQSSCDWKRIRIEGSERHLRIYILTLLKKLCTFEVIRALKATRKDALDVSFQFEMIDEFTPYSLQRDSDFIVGNVITFRRTAPDSVLDYQIGPIRGVWFAPAIALDFPWLIEKWDQYVNGIDPMEPFRD